MFILNQVQSVENLSDMKNLEFMVEKPVEAPSMVEKQIPASGTISSKSKESQQSKLSPEKTKSNTQSTRSDEENKAVEIKTSPR